MALHPGEQLAIAVIGCWELSVTEQPPEFIENRGVMGALVGVDTADARHILCRHAGIRSPARFAADGERAGRAERQVCDGASGQAPIRSDPSGRRAPEHRTDPDRHIERRTPWSYLGRGQTRAGAAPTPVFTDLAVLPGTVRLDEHLPGPELGDDARSECW